MRNIERLLPLLRCLRCSGGLNLKDNSLGCPFCGTVYPVINDIPVLLEQSEQDRVWQEYFDRRGSELGDREEANSYISRRNFRFVRTHLLRQVGDVRRHTVLDVGCGTGHFSQSLAAENLLVGVDISLEMAGLAAKKGLAVVQSSGQKLPFADRSFDLVIANNVVQSFKDCRPLVRELVRTARPGGRIILSSTNGENLSLKLFRFAEKRKSRHLGLHAAGSLKRALESCGATVRSVLFFHYPIGIVRKSSAVSPFSPADRWFASTIALEAVNRA